MHDIPKTIFTFAAAHAILLTVATNMLFPSIAYLAICAITPRKGTATIHFIANEIILICIVLHPARGRKHANTGKSMKFFIKFIHYTPQGDGTNKKQAAPLGGAACFL